MNAYARLMRWHRPIGIFLLLWPTLWALWIAAHGWPKWDILLIFVAGVFVMRSAGCVINDIVDRKFDGNVARTQDRPLVTGEVSVKKAYSVFAILCVIAFGLVLFLNLLTLLIALVALVFAIIYPFAKRYTHWPQLVLGACWNLSIPMAFAAQTNHIPSVTWLIYVIAVLWTIVYDSMYAMVDREDDKKIGIKSTAILFGKYDRLIVGTFQIIIILLLTLLGLIEKLGLIYYFSVGVAACFSLYQQYLIKDCEPKKCFTAFLNNNWFGLVIWIGLVINFI